MVIKLRTKHNLTQQELATLAGTSHSVIARIENGRTKTTLRTLRRIVTAVNGRAPPLGPLSLHV